MMNRKLKLLTLTLLLAIACTLPTMTWAQEDDVTVKKDLFALLALKGKPCGEITQLQKQGENDYLVTCKNGSRYRIYIDAQDRVQVEDRK